MTHIEQALRTRLHAVKDSRDCDRRRHDQHFAELTEVKAQLHTERALRANMEATLANVIKSLEEGTPPVDVARGARTVLGLGCGDPL
jgi:hypothetical protein